MTMSRIERQARVEELQQWMQEQQDEFGSDPFTPEVQRMWDNHTGELVRHQQILDQGASAPDASLSLGSSFVAITIRRIANALAADGVITAPCVAAFSPRTRQLVWDAEALRTQRAHARARTSRPWVRPPDHNKYSDFGGLGVGKTPCVNILQLA
jgi:hypothetical protein